VIRYSEFRLRIEKGDSAGTFAVFASGPSGEASATFRSPFQPVEVENLVLKLSRPRQSVRRVDSPEFESVRRFGSELFASLFTGGVRDLYRDALATARAQGRGLRISLALTEAPELLQLPWEYLYEEPSFLAISTWTPVVRYLDLPRTRPPLHVEGPLRLLAMVSSPSDVVKLDVDAERRKLEEALAELCAANLVQIDWLEQATLASLQRALRRAEYQIFHYIGHGGYDETIDDGVLLLEDEAGRSRAVNGMHLGTILSDEASLRLIVLNACEGARSSITDPFAGVATSLVQREMPAVVAMQFEITDRAAIAFSSALYAALSDGYPIDAALAEARKAIFADQNDVEWGTPVLFMRVPDGQIFRISADRPRARTDPPVALAPASEPLQAAALAGAHAPAPSETPNGEPLVTTGDGGHAQSGVGDFQAAKRQSALARLRSRLRGARVRALAGLVLAAGVVAGLLIWLLGGGSPPPAEPNFSWVTKALPGGHANEEMMALAAGGASLIVAGGFDSRQGLEARPEAWSFDGSRWQRLSLPIPPGTHYAIVNGIASGGGRLIAVGQFGSAPAQTDPSIWTKGVLSGGGWQQRCPNEPQGLCAGAKPHGLGVLYDVVAWAPGGMRPSWSYLAVGGVTQPGAHKFDDAAVWRSSDGLRWAPIADPSFRGSHSQIIKAVAVAGRGTVVAVGRDGLQGAAWYSSDERSWQAAAAAAFDVPGGGSAELNDLVLWQSTLIAVGRKTIDKRPQAAVWISRDQGHSWASVDSQSFVVADQRGAVMTGIAAGSSRIVAVGYAHVGTQAVAATWTSGDGRTWQRVESPSFSGHGSREMNAVFADGDTFYGGGDATTSGSARKAQVWTGRKRK
jgi:CHAT domain-containing protein